MEGNRMRDMVRFELSKEIEGCFLSLFDLLTLTVCRHVSCVLNIVIVVEW